MFFKFVGTAWLLAAALPLQAIAQPNEGTGNGLGCTRTLINGFTNPSFELGDLTGWTTQSARGVSLNGQVVEGDAQDGSHLYEVVPTSIWSYTMQPVTGLDTAATYTLSVSYKLVFNQPPTAAGTKSCFINWAVDRWDAMVVRQWAIVTPSAYGSDPEWATFTLSFEPTAAAHSIYFDFACLVPYVTMSLDNFLLPLGETESCPTPTPIPTPTPTPTPIPLTLASSPISSPADVSSSAVLSGSSFASSHGVIPSSPAISSTAAISSSSAVASSSTVAHSHSSGSNTASSSVVVSVPSSTPSSARPSSSVIVISSPSALPSSFVTKFSTIGTPDAAGHLSTPALSSFHSSTVLVPLPSLRPSSSFVVNPGSPTSLLPLVTSTVLSTRVSTVTSCPTAQPDCPARSRTTSVTTETVVAYTTICPAKSTRTDQPQPTVSTSSIFSTRTATVTLCPGHAKYCPLPQRKTTVTTETILASITVIPIEPTHTVTTTIYVTEARPEVSTHTATVYVTETQTALITFCPQP